MKPTTVRPVAPRIIKDISFGKEKYPIRVINNIDTEPWPPFIENCLKNAKKYYQLKSHRHPDLTDKQRKTLKNLLDTRKQGHKPCNCSDIDQDYGQCVDFKRTNTTVDPC